MFGLNLAQWLILGGGLVAFVLLQFRGRIAAAFSGWKLPSIGGNTETPKPSRMEVLAHLDAAFGYFDGIGCKEGMDAIRTASQHAFEHRGAK